MLSTCLGNSFFIEEVLRGSDFSINASYFQDLFSQAHRVVSEFRLKLKVLHMSHHEAWKILEANEILPKVQRCLQTSCLSRQYFALLMFPTSKAGYLRVFLHQDSSDVESFFCRRFLVHCPTCHRDLIMHYETQLRNFERVDFWVQNRRSKNTRRLRNSGYAVACGYGYG